MTREQAHAKGWDFGMISGGKDNCYAGSCHRYKDGILADATVTRWGYSIEEVESKLLSAIESIESYPSAVALLEECRDALENAIVSMKHMGIRTGHQDDVLAKLEARLHREVDALRKLINEGLAKAEKVS